MLKYHQQKLLSWLYLLKKTFIKFILLISTPKIIQNNSVRKNKKEAESPMPFTCYSTLVYRTIARAGQQYFILRRNLPILRLTI